jgi:hypothetical protein
MFFLLSFETKIYASSLLCNLRHLKPYFNNAKIMRVKYTGVQETLHKILSPAHVVWCCIAVRKDLTLQEIICLYR